MHLYLHSVKSSRILLLNISSLLLCVQDPTCTLCQYLSYGSGVKKIEFDMDNQKVFVESTLGSEELLAKIKKTGRECSYVGVKE